MQQSVINGLSEGEEQVFDTIKSEVVSTIKQQGLFYADEIIDEKLKEIEQSDSISAAGLEIIRDSLHTIPKVITLTAERQPEEVVETVVAESNSKSWIRPCGKIVTSPFGWRIHPTLNTRTFHDGIDIVAGKNTPVYAVADGKVIYAGWNGGYGNYIKIQHSNGFESFYGHLNQIDVENNDIVTQGNKIGLSGNTAGIGKNGVKLSTGYHLHFGMHQNGKPVDPLIYIPKFKILKK